VQALRQHKSQLGKWDPEKMIREWAAGTAKEHGMAYAESYHKMILVEEEQASD